MWPFEYLIKKPPVPTKRATVGLINVKSCSALLHMLLVSTRSYIKSGLWYKFLILETCHPDTIFMWSRMWGSVFIFRSQQASARKKFGKHSTMWLDVFGGDAGVSVIFSNDTWLLILRFGFGFSRSTRIDEVNMKMTHHLRCDGL
jgi:hypothetical protein